MRNLTRLLHSQQGNVLMLVGLGFMALIGATGVALDMSRLQNAQSKLSSALDAAGLAAGSKAHSEDVQAVVQNYMAVNYPPGFMNSHITELTAVMNEDAALINLKATAEVDMSFMQIFGQNSKKIYATSEITRENRGLELVMALDVTGSMAGSKIASLRSAASDMLSILFGSKETMENLWVGIVPYVTSVNIGADKTAWLRNYDLTRYPPEYPVSAVKWKGCVESRTQYPVTNGLDLTDDIPDAKKPETLFPMYFWPSTTGHANNEWIKTTTTTKNGVPKTTTTVTLNQNPGYDNGNAKGPNVACGNPVLPFTSQKSVAQAAVNALVPWPRGGTISSEGMAWAWRLISPKWRGLWAHESNTLPLDYNTPLMSKAVIIMTDGTNTIYNGTNPYPDNSGSDYMSYGFIKEEKLGKNATNVSAGLTAINTKFATICSSMKSKGIIIYSITFQLGTSSADNNARAMFRNCATKPEYYFDSPDGDTLRRSFRQIGDSLANLMISR